MDAIAAARRRMIVTAMIKKSKQKRALKAVLKLLDPE